MRALIFIGLFVLSGCAYPVNLANDLTHMGNPTYAACRRNADITSAYGSRCAYEADPKIIAENAEQERQVAEKQKQAAAAAEAAQKAIIDKAAKKGYELHTVRDLYFDGKALASRDAKVQVSGIYMRHGDSEALYLSQFDAVQ